MIKVMMLAVGLFASTVVYADVISVNHNGGLTVNVWADGNWFLRGLVNSG